MTRMELEIIFAAEPRFRLWFECAWAASRSINVVKWSEFVNKTGGPEVLRSVWKNTYPDIDVYEAYKSWKKEKQND